MSTLLALAAFLAGCGGSETITDPACTLSVTVTPASLALEVGETGGLVSSVSSSGDCSGGNVAWTSSNAGVASVAGSGSTGTVTGVAQGTAVITATMNDGSGTSASDVASVTVTRPPCVLNVSVSPSTATLEEGETTTLSASVSSQGGCDDPATSWSSSDTDVALVASDGTVTAVSAGAAGITATVADGSGASATAQATITVTRPPCVLAVAVSPSSATLEEGETTTLSASVSSQGGCDGTTTSWSSSNAGVASVASDGTVTAVSAGAAGITATVTDATGTSASDLATVTVTQTCGLTLSVNPSAVSIEVGNEMALSTNTTSTGSCTGTSTAWSSSDESVVRVSSTGRLTGWGSGVTTVTATVTDGTGTTISDATTVWVSAPGDPIMTSRFSFSEEGGSGTMLEDPISDVTAIIAEGGSNDAVAANGQVTLTGGAWDNSDWIGFARPLGEVGPRGTDFTIELWATQHSVKQWGRILFISDKEANAYFTMSWTLGSSPGLDRIEWKNVFTQDGTMGGYELNQEHHIVLTVEHDFPQTTLCWYLDGQRRACQTTEVETLLSLDEGPPRVDEVWHMLGRSLIETDETANASFNEYRIWRGAMSAAEVALSSQRGPNPGG